MKNTLLIKTLSLFGILLFLSSCSSSKLISTWKDEKIKVQPYKKLLVIALTKDRDRKILFEKMFAEEFEDYGVEVVPSYKVLPMETKLSKEDITKAIKGKNVEGVLITILRSIDKETSYSPGHPVFMTGVNYYSMYSYYNYAYGYVYTPGYQQQKVRVHLETNLYDIKTEELVWSGLSETVDPQSPREVVETVQPLIIKELRSNEFIK